MRNKFTIFIRRFFKIWIEPRQTLRAILDEQPGYHVWTFIVVYAFFQAFEPEYYFFFAGRGPLDVQLLIGLVISIGFDVLALFFFSGFWLMIGKWMGGKANFKEVMTAYAWSYPPSIIGIILLQLGNIPKWLTLLSGETDLKSLLARPHMSWESPSQGISLLLVGWTTVLLVINLSEAHKISIPRSIALVLTILVPFTLIVVVGIALLMLSQLGIHWH